MRRVIRALHWVGIQTREGASGRKLQAGCWAALLALPPLSCPVPSRPHLGNRVTLTAESRCESLLRLGRAGGAGRHGPQCALGGVCCHGNICTVAGEGHVLATLRLGRRFPGS